MRAAVKRAGLWEALETDWLVLDCELLPWSAKAMELIRRQYAAVGAAGSAGLRGHGGRARGGRGARAGRRRRCSTQHPRPRRPRRPLRRRLPRYVWPVDGLDDLRLAPFHVLAAESGVFVGRDHAWHLEHCDALVAADPDWFRRTERRFVDVTDPASEAEATVEWWESLTAAGGEGMVVKPRDFNFSGRRGSPSPA